MQGKRVAPRGLRFDKSPETGIERIAGIAKNEFFAGGDEL